MKLGAQMYTVRNFCKTTEDFANTLDRLADIGYTAVQVSGTCPFEADWLAEQLKRTGLTCNITHTDPKLILGETDKVIADHKVFGCKHIGLGGMPTEYRGSFENVQKFHADYAEAAKKIRDAGALFMYHNHAFEYERVADGRTQMEVLSDLFAPDEMGFTLDTYWVKFGGFDPVAEIKRLSGRIPCVHFKDMEVLEDGTRRYTWVGNGVLDFGKIIYALEDTGTEYAFVEEDDCFGEDPFECLTKSYKYLKALGLK